MDVVRLAGFVLVLWIVLAVPVALVAGGICSRMNGDTGEGALGGGADVTAR